MNTNLNPFTIMCNSKNIPSVIYNEQDNTASVTINFSITKENNTGRPISTDKIYGAFQKVMIKALNDRLAACTNNLIKCQGSITKMNNYAIEYYKNGIRRHYSFPAADAMRSALEKLERQHYVFTAAETLQILKALMWVEKKEDQQGIPFQILIDLLSEHLIFETQAPFVEREHELSTELDKQRNENEELRAKLNMEH